MEGGDVTLRASGIWKSFKGLTVLAGVSLSVRRGEVVAIAARTARVKQRSSGYSLASRLLIRGR